jgi:hypothetical protein
LLIAITSAALLSATSAPARGQQATAPPAAVVSVVIDYGDGVKKTFTALPWKKGMTVLDALRAASAHPRGIQFKHRGKKETAFVTEVDGLENEGAGNNWLFFVNKKMGKRSCGVIELLRGDAVLWKFGKYK